MRARNPTKSRIYRHSLIDPFAEPELLTKEPGMFGAVFAPITACMW